MAGEEARRPVRPDDGIRVGIRCPYCNCGHHEVTQTRASEVTIEGVRREFILRWRRCRYCGCTWKTREVNEPEIPDEIKSPAQAKRVAQEIDKTLRNLLPREDVVDDFPLLDNPYLDLPDS